MENLLSKIFDIEKIQEYEKSSGLKINSVKFIENEIRSL